MSKLQKIGAVDVEGSEYIAYREEETQTIYFVNVADGNAIKMYPIEKTPYETATPQTVENAVARLSDKLALARRKNGNGEKKYVPHP